LANVFISHRGPDSAEAERLGTAIGLYPWIDPAEPIDAAAIERAAEVPPMTVEEVRRRYEGLAERFGLVLA
jgi:hypothetical protein